VEYQALITNITVNDDAFAIIPDTQEGVYIPPGVTRASKLVAGELRRLNVIPNNPERQSNTKWMGVFVYPPETEMPETHREEQPATTDLREQTMALFEEDDAYLTTGEVAARLEIPTMKARDILTKLFTEQRLARADVHYKSLKRAVNVLWAKTPEDFL
jgi:hypothetical protein